MLDLFGMLLSFTYMQNTALNARLVLANIAIEKAESGKAHKVNINALNKRVAHFHNQYMFAKAATVYFCITTVVSVLKNGGL